MFGDSVGQLLRPRRSVTSLPPEVNSQEEAIKQQERDYILKEVENLDRELEEFSKKGLAQIKEKRPDIIKTIDDIKKDTELFPEQNVSFP